MRVVLERFALQELLDDVNYYSILSTKTANKFVSDLEHAVSLIKEHSLAFPERFNGFRKCFFKKFNYALIYKAEITQIVIVAVMHNGREPNYWHKRAEQ
jgi:plasmid stabilization system protein ParE